MGYQILGIGAASVGLLMIVLGLVLPQAYEGMMPLKDTAYDVHDTHGDSGYKLAKFKAAMSKDALKRTKKAHVIGKGMLTGSDEDGHDLVKPPLIVPRIARLKSRDEILVEIGTTHALNQVSSPVA